MGKEWGGTMKVADEEQNRAMQLCDIGHCNTDLT